MSKWSEFRALEETYRTKDGEYFEYKRGSDYWIESRFHHKVKEHYQRYLKQTKTYEKLETEARIKKLEWTIAEQQLEIERLRQKELELSKGNNNE